VAGQLFSPDTPVSSNIKADSYEITVIVLKLVLNTINLFLFCLLIQKLLKQSLFVPVQS